MQQPGRGSRRVQIGSGIDPACPIRFTFDGAQHVGYKGDTLASALLANGVAIVGRSFKYHRPRGIFSAGVEEPNALVRLGEPPHEEPVVRATEVELYEGLTAQSLNAWPSAKRDLFGLLDKLHRFLPAGFYYKTFKWPAWDWHSKVIRRMAGLGEIPQRPDPDFYVKRNAWCDLLVIGSGPAGLGAALEGARTGASLILVEQQAEFGGSALWRPGTIAGAGQRRWAEAAVAELRGLPNVRMLNRTMAFGYYDHDLVTAVERASDHLEPGARDGLPRQRLWKIRAAEVVVATGAIERPMVFRDNDRPGVMLAGAVHEYLARYGILAGTKAVVATNNDSAYETALALKKAGASVVVLDSRAKAAESISEQARIAQIPIRWHSRIERAKGAPVRSIRFVSGPDGKHEDLDCNLVAVSAGWTPTIHLYSQAGGSLGFDEALQTFVPRNCPHPVRAVGAAAGQFDFMKQSEEGETSRAVAPLPTWVEHRPDRQWVDLHNDVTVADVELAARENFVSVEHLKRYTTTGMAVDQGKTSNVNALLQLAIATGRAPGQVGTTKFRPPFSPVTFGALAGQVVGERYHPLRRLPAHADHLQAGAAMTEMSGWLRPEYYPAPGETAADAIQREILAVRNTVGLFDSSPLGKIEICGPDAAILLGRLYGIDAQTLRLGEVVNRFAMDDHGIILDDSHIARLDEHRYLLLTTTSAGPKLAALIERHLQIDWPELDAFSTLVTTQWAMFSLAGPRSLELLQRLEGGPVLAVCDPMTVSEGQLAGTKVRILRISYTGERAYEVMVPALAASRLWNAIRAAGAELGLELFGLEALDALRIEKGFPHIGVETESTTIPADLRAEPLPHTPDALGLRSAARPEAVQPVRLELVGLLCDDSKEPLPIGAEISSGWEADAEGHVTSSIYSPTLGRPVALAMLTSGRSRTGERVKLQHGGQTRSAIVAEPCFHDPDGRRL